MTFSACASAGGGQPKDLWPVGFLLATLEIATVDDAREVRAAAEHMHRRDALGCEMSLSSF